MSQLNSIHNSTLAINRIIPDDVLYDIFKLVIYNSTHPGRTALNISYVCRHWRRSALGWPTLWGFVDLNNPGLAMDVFLSRSQNAPLTLSLDWPYRTLNSNQSMYFESRATLILPRLCSLTLHLLSSELPKIQHVFQNPQLQPLRLRHLDISCEAGFGRARLPSLTDFLNIDIFCLRELKLQSISLPWPEIPHNKLTHFTLRNPINPPTLSHLLVFLSSCPLLRELEIVVWAHVDVKIETSNSSCAAIQRLDFPNLESLTLESRGLSYYYIHEISTRIRTLGSLSRFRLCYPDFNPPDDQSASTGHQPFNMFEAVPSGALRHFSSHRYLYIDFELFRGSFQISSVLERRAGLSSQSLYLSGTWHPNWVFDRSPILELMHVMPEITRLGLGYEAWGILTSWNIDIRGVFPCLSTLELWWPDWADPINSLNSLELARLNLKTLVLPHSGKISYQDFLDVILKTGVEVLELGPSYYDKADFAEVLTILRQRGVVLVTFDGNYLMHMY